MKNQFIATRLAVALIALIGINSVATAQQARQAPAYDKAQTKTALTRSVFYLPLFGAVYREKFAALVAREPGVRGVIIRLCSRYVGVKLPPLMQPVDLHTKFMKP